MNKRATWELLVKLTLELSSLRATCQNKRGVFVQYSGLTTRDPAHDPQDNSIGGPNDYAYRM